MNLYPTSALRPKVYIGYTLVLLVLVFSDVLLDLLLVLPHFALGLLHFFFETCEQLLDLLIEHLFHTSPRGTEIIVFYIMASGIGWMGFKFIKSLPQWYYRIYESLSIYYQHKKTCVINELHSLPLIEKFKWGSVFMTSTIMMVVLTMT